MDLGNDLFGVWVLECQRTGGANREVGNGNMIYIVCLKNRRVEKALVTR